MRRWAWVKAGLLLLAVLLAAGGVLAWLVKREPDFYAQAVAVPPQADDPKMASETQTRIGELVLAVTNPYNAPGDWAHTVNAEPGGWCFEHANPHYPDLDDTAMAVMALACQFDRSGARAEPLPPGLELVHETEADDRAAALRAVTLLDKTAGAIERATRWMAAMQNRDGGWGAFDKDNDRRFLCHVPFADHNAMIDPSTESTRATGGTTTFRKRIQRSRRETASRSSRGIGGTQCGFTIPRITM